jgi:hypothetical protein
MIARVPADLERFVFVDFGSGLGKVLLLASVYPFRSVIGVEFSPELHRLACENIRRYASGTQQCNKLFSVCQDAAEFRLPPEPFRAVTYCLDP